MPALCVIIKKKEVKIETLIALYIMFSLISLSALKNWLFNYPKETKMLKKPYEGDYPATLEFGESYNGILGLGNTKHLGIDIAMPTGTAIIAPANGKIEEINTCPSCGDWGKYIKIKINDLWIYFSHLSDVFVDKGQNVEEGTILGRSGSTGRVTGPHLDIRVHDLLKWNQPMRDFQDPRKYIDFEGVPKPDQEPASNAEPSPLESDGRLYTVQPGDSLWRISKIFYGQGSKWQKIYEANKNIIDDPDKIYPNQNLIIPD
jgi:murein DD-endopeptidase MepM/ murein hydrolase activator NlpD